MLETKMILLLLIMGFLIGLIFSFVCWVARRPDGYFFVNLTNPNEEMFKMQIDIPLEELPAADYLIFTVRKTQ